MSEFTIPFTGVTWTTGDTITEAKLDNMTANDQAFDAHEDQGFQLVRRSGDPSTPASTKLRLYAKDYDGKTALFVINENGEVFRLNDDPIITDQLDEATAGHGIDVDGLNIKDSKLNTNDSVVTTNITDNAVTNAKLRQSVARSVVGRSAATTGDVADIIAGADAHVLRRSGTTIGFGTIGQASAPTLLAGPGNNYKVQIGTATIGTNNSPGYYYADISVNFANTNYRVACTGTGSRFDYRVASKSTSNCRIRSDIMGSHSFDYIMIGT